MKTKLESLHTTLARLNPHATGLRTILKPLTPLRTIYGHTYVDPDTVRDFAHVESVDAMRFDSSRDCDL